MDQIIVEQGTLITAGGITAWMDLVLVLISRLYGRSEAITLGKYFLVDTGLRKQSYYTSFMPEFDHKDNLVLAVQRGIEQQFAEPLTIEDMAGWVHVSPRTLQRRFRAATGETIVRYLQKLRLSKAQKMLENSRKAIGRISVEVGYVDVSSFRKLFRRQFGLTPSKYRQRFFIQHV